jgi:hypothetical protein
MKNRRYLLEAAFLSLLSTFVFAPWGCVTSPLAPGPASDALTLELPNGVVALPGRLLGEVDKAPPGTFELSPLPYTLDSGIIIDTKLLEEYGPFVKDITSAGGTIIMTIDEDTSYFVVPDEGLDKTTEIGITLKRDLNAADARVTEFEFQPEGLRFEKPAQLAYRTNTKDGDKLVLYWWEGRTGTWVGSAEAIVVNGYATFPIEHFSKYRTKEKISLGGQRQGN